MKHPRTNWLLRWGGAAVCAALLSLYPLTLRWSSYAVPSTNVLLGLETGEVGVRWWKDPGPSDFTLPPVGSQGSLAARCGIEDWRWLPGTGAISGWRWLSVPLWVPFVAALVPTARAWRSWRRWLRRPGVCPTCGYDLAGLAGGVCPECGTAPTL